MSRETITLIAPNGAKVRTVRSKSLFVVRYGTEHHRYLSGRTSPGGEWVPGRWETLPDPKPFAHVDKRTDSPITALAALNKIGAHGVVFAVAHSEVDGLARAWILSREALEDRAAAAKQARKWLADLPTRGF